MRFQAGLTGYTHGRRLTNTP